MGALHRPRTSSQRHPAALCRGDALSPLQYREKAILKKKSPNPHPSSTDLPDQLNTRGFGGGSEIAIAPEQAPGCPKDIGTPEAKCGAIFCSVWSQCQMPTCTKRCLDTQLTQPREGQRADSGEIHTFEHAAYFLCLNIFSFTFLGVLPLLTKPC